MVAVISRRGYALDRICAERHDVGVLQILTTNEFATWFGALEDDALAEEVGTALEVIEQLGPGRPAPGSSESLLWYEHPIATGFDVDDPPKAGVAPRSGNLDVAYARVLELRNGGAGVLPTAFAWHMDSWGAFRTYTRRVLRHLESAKFIERVAALAKNEADIVLEALRQIRRTARAQWNWRTYASVLRIEDALRIAEEQCAEVRRLYLDALEAAGFERTDIAPHTVALRELTRRFPSPGFRLLYGVDTATETALVAVGERLTRSFYGDSVRLAERLWNRYLAGDLRTSPDRPHTT
jgi:hypothetical protein